MRLAQDLGVELEDLAVVGEKAVDLDLDVGRLGVDRAAKPLLREIPDLLHNSEICLFKPLARDRKSVV